MRKYTKKEKKSLNSEKEEKRRALGKQLRDEIDKRFKTYTEFREACTEHSNYAGNSSGNEYITAQHLSNLMSGESPISPDKAEVFSKVLGVPVTYLLGFDKYPSEEAREEAEWMDAVKGWDKEDRERIAIFKRVMTILSDRQYVFHFSLSYTNYPENTKHTAELYSRNMQHTLFDNGSRYIIDDIVFFDWLRFSDLVMKYTADNTTKWYHFIGVEIVSDNHKLINIDMNSFMRMIYDIDESIKATIQNRCDFWMNYANYDYKVELEKSF